ncbi:MAG: GDSL-type esterase/lipase family protein [Acetobacteraceae bacterium]|nr:GDSL-type esterase/lipase family protein [Acetobacteraceae bacterium]
MSRMLRLFFACLLLTGLALTAPALTGSAWAQPHARPVLAAVPIGRLDLPWWKLRHQEKLAELKQKHPALLFLGDSITQNWEHAGPPPTQDFAPVWQRFYGDRNAVNLGFIGDTTASLLWRIDNGEVAGIAPKVAVVLIGANNFGRVHWSAENTLTGIAAILHELHTRLPQTKILLLGVLPSERAEWVSESTVAVNKALAAKYGAGGDGVTFLDVGHVFMTGGHFDRSLFYDPLLTPPDPPLHPTAEGMGRLAAAMEPTLAALLGDKPHH